MGACGLQHAGQEQCCKAWLLVQRAMQLCPMHRHLCAAWINGSMQVQALYAMGTGQRGIGGFWCPT